MMATNFRRDKYIQHLRNLLMDDGREHVQASPDLLKPRTSWQLSSSATGGDSHGRKGQFAGTHPYHALYTMRGRRERSRASYTMPFAPLPSSTSCLFLLNTMSSN